MNDTVKTKPKAKSPAELEAESQAKLKDDVIKWITAFNTEKGWRSLRGQKNPIKGLKDSPVTQLTADQVLDGPGRTALTQEIAANRGRLAKILEDMKTEPQGDSYDLLEADREDTASKIANDETILATANRLEAQLAKLQAAETGLPSALSDLRGEIKRLEKAADEEAFNPAKLDQNILSAFRADHERIAKEVEKARSEVISIDSPNGTSKSYAVVNDVEYKILLGMLQKSMLLLQGNDLSTAMKCLAEAEAKLIQYRSARANTTETVGRVSLLGDLEGPMNTLKTVIETVGRRPFAAAAATKLWADHAAFESGIATYVANNPAGIKSQFSSAIQTVTANGRQILDQALAIEKTLLRISTDIATMKANGHLQPSLDFATDLADFQTTTATQTDLTTAVANANALAKTVRDRLDKSKAEDARLADELTPDAVKGQADALQARYDDLFKDGVIATIKKQILGDAKDSKKDSDIPKEALREIELQILTAQQLAGSDSIDALAHADQFIAEATNFLDAIKDNPKVYSDRIKAFDDVGKIINDLQSRYSLYLPGDRLDLSAALDNLRNTQMTRPQSEIETETTALLKKANDLRVTVQHMQTRKRALDTQADRVKALIENVSDRFKNDVKVLGGFSGYYGPEIADLRLVRDHIAERTDQSLNKATTLLDKMESDLGVARVLLKKHKDKKQEFETGESATLWETIEKARIGQGDHDADKAEKKAFESGMEALKKDLSKTKEALKSLKADLNELTALDAERSALNAEMDKTGEYRKGVAQLQGLQSRAADMNADAERAKEILDTNLAEAAAECVREVKIFVTKLSGFVDSAIKPAGETASGNDLDNKVYDKAAINAFFAKLAASVNAVGLDLIGSQSAVTADRSVSVDKRKIARKTALAELRKLMALFDSFEPMLHLRRHPFGKNDATSQLVSARQTFPRLEKRLLTAIKD